MIDNSVAKPVADMLTLCHFWSDDDIFQCKASLIMLFKASSTWWFKHTPPDVAMQMQDQLIFVLLCLQKKTKNLCIWGHHHFKLSYINILTAQFPLTCLCLYGFKTCSYLITVEGHWSTPPALCDLLNWTTNSDSHKKKLLCTYLFIFLTATALSLRLFSSESKWHPVHFSQAAQFFCVLMAASILFAQWN